MKVIVDVSKKTLKVIENERSIFRGEYGADKLTLLINKTLVNEYPTITALLSNGRKIGAFTTDDAYGNETIDGVTYTVANFTLSKENGFTLSEGKMQVTIWMNSDGKREAIGNLLLNVVNTTAFDDENIIISDDVTGAVVNMREEINNIASLTSATSLKVKGYSDLGDLTQSPSSQNNATLNAINQTGIYTFTYSGNTYLMLVNTKDNNLKQIVIGIETQSIDIKYWIRTPYYDTFMVTPFETTNKDYFEEELIKIRNFVNDKFANLMGGENINEMYDTIKEIAEALASNKAVDEALSNALIDKADKTEIPTKLSQLEQDIAVGGVDEEEVLEIIEQNSEQVEELRIATSGNYDASSDSEIPTTKAVADMIANLSGGGSVPIGKYKHSLKIKCDASAGVGYDITEFRFEVVNNNPEPYSYEHGDYEEVEDFILEISGTYNAYCVFEATDYEFDEHPIKGYYDVVIGFDEEAGYGVIKSDIYGGYYDASTVMLITDTVTEV